MALSPRGALVYRPPRGPSAMPVEVPLQRRVRSRWGRLIDMTPRVAKLPGLATVEETKPRDVRVRYSYCGCLWHTVGGCGFTNIIRACESMFDLRLGEQVDDVFVVVVVIHPADCDPHSVFWIADSLFSEVQQLRSTLDSVWKQTFLPASVSLDRNRELRTRIAMILSMAGATLRWDCEA